MQDKLLKVQRWSGHGTIRQFQSELSARLSEDGYETAIEGEALVCYRIRKEGGFLGIGAKTIREPVLRVNYVDGLANLDEKSADPEFIEYLSGLLTAH